MKIDILTLFPDVFPAFFGASIIGRAVDAGLVKFEFTNFRDFATDPHRSVDDRPFGGGPGMVLMCGPVFDAVESVTRGCSLKPLVVLLTPQGERLTQKLVQRLAGQEHLVVVCGHYEGFDERIRTGLGALEVSVGDYVLSGGEAAAMVLVDSVVRLIPGALGNENATDDESFSDGLLEYPQYTRPRSFGGEDVPEVLLSGHHREIEAWRRQKALERTRERRPDLLADEDNGT